jgi:pimeloyl-ACP methyl ester carboxylesterase
MRRFLALLAVGVAGAAPAAGITRDTSAGYCPAGVDAPARIPLDKLRRMYGAPDDRYVTIDGVELRYRDEGKGPVLLLLHGSRSTLNQWDGVTARLKARYRVLRFDQPPGGLSGPLRKEAIAAVGSPEALVAKFLDRLGVARVRIAGVSSGGTMAYYFAASHPERVDAVILSNTPADSVAEAHFEVPAALQAATDRARAVGVEGRAFWSNYLTFLYGEPARMAPGLIDKYCTLNLREKEPNPFGLHALTANKARTAEQLAAVRAPVLILWGMRDPVLTPPAATVLAGKLVHAKSVSFVAMDSVGHYPPMESPAAFADLMDTYLRRDRQ